MFTCGLKHWLIFCFMYQSNNKGEGGTARREEKTHCMDLAKAPLTSQKNLALLLSETLEVLSCAHFVIHV